MTLARAPCTYVRQWHFDHCLETCGHANAICSGQTCQANSDCCGGTVCCANTGFTCVADCPVVK